MLVDGIWIDIDRDVKNGRYIRPVSAYADDLGHNIIECLANEPGRYMLIASLSCPWSHRVLLIRALKGLTDSLPLQIAGEPRLEGYALASGRDWTVPGTDKRIRHLHQLYTAAEPEYTGRATVPVLWDRKRCRIVSNESARLIRALDGVDSEDQQSFTFAPPCLRYAIDSLNKELYRGLCNAVYRVGMARNQSVYDEEIETVFAALTRLEHRLSNRRYLFGNVITESDWCLFPTLVRFDCVYYIHFKCSRRRLVEYPNLWAYARDLWSWFGVASTVDYESIRTGYYFNDRSINPMGIIATPPNIDWHEPHKRERFGEARVTLRSGEEVEINPGTLEFLKDKME